MSAGSPRSWARVAPARAFGATALLLAVALLAASCLLVDPPPALATIPPGAPSILTESVSPPAPDFTNWVEGAELTFVVPVQVNDPASTFQWFVFEDYNLPISTLIHHSASTADLDGGDIQVINFSVSPPPGTSCHYISFFADADSTGVDFTTAIPASLTCLLCTKITWVYDPSGTGDCLYDAGGIGDADILREGSADATDASISVFGDP
jgi:hypothetical protein